MSKRATNRTTQEKEKMINQRFQVIADSWAQWNWSVQEQIESFSDSLGGTRDHVEERNQVSLKAILDESITLTLQALTTTLKHCLREKAIYERQCWRYHIFDHNKR